MRLPQMRAVRTSTALAQAGLLSKNEGRDFSGNSPGLGSGVMPSGRGECGCGRGRRCAGDCRRIPFTGEEVCIGGCVPW
jgi:hypothetical protein